MLKRLILMVLVLVVMGVSSPSALAGISPINGGEIYPSQGGARIADCPAVDTFGQWDYVEVEPIWPVALATRISRRFVIWDIWQANFYNQMGQAVVGQDYLQGIYIAGIWGVSNGFNLETWTVWYWQGDYYVMHDSGCTVAFHVVSIMADWDNEVRALYGG